MMSRYSGRCAACDEYYPEGTPIESSAVGWAHVHCPSETFEPEPHQGMFLCGPRPRRKRRPACTVCFLELPTSNVCGNCE
jgi:hypothetical protein